MSEINCKFCGNTKPSITGRSIECYTEEARDECLNWKEMRGKQRNPKEAVDHPQHYGGDTPFEVIKVLRNWLTPEEYIGFLRGNYIKYLARFHMKGGLEDLRKANWYLNKHIENMEEKKRGGDGPPK